MPEDAVSLLALLRSSEDPARRVLAASALAELGDPDLAGALLAHWRTETDWRVRVALLDAAAALGGAEVDAVLVDLLRSGEDSREGVLFRETAAAALAGRGTPGALAALESIIRAGGAGLGGDEAETGRRVALESLGNHGGEAALPLLAGLAGDSSADPLLRSEAFRALGSSEAPAAGQVLRDLLATALAAGGPADAVEGEGAGIGEGEDPRVSAVTALSSREMDPETLKVLLPLASGTTVAPEVVRRRAFGGLARSGGKEEVAVLLASARDPGASAATRRAAWYAYASALGAAAVPALLETALGTAAEEDRLAVVKELRRVGGEEARGALEEIAGKAGGRVAELAMSYLR